jgi:uncharacterized membrane protein
MADSITKSLIVKGNISDVYNIWANFENFSKFMKHIKSVTKQGRDASHWVMQGPLGVKIEWDAKITRMEDNRRIAWNSVDSDTKTSGQVTFQRLSDGETQITVMLHYDPPAGLTGEVLAELFGDPEGRLTEDLQNFKTYVESTSERIHAGRT